MPRNTLIWASLAVGLFLCLVAGGIGIGSAFLTVNPSISIPKNSPNLVGKWKMLEERGPYNPAALNKQPPVTEFKSNGTGTWRAGEPRFNWQVTTEEKPVLVINPGKSARYFQIAIDGETLTLTSLEPPFTTPEGKEVHNILILRRLK